MPIRCRVSEHSQWVDESTFSGTQTVHSVPVLADWSPEALEAALGEDVPCFYVLANTRALPPAEVQRAKEMATSSSPQPTALLPSQAAARAEEIGSNLRVAAARRRPLPIWSPSQSGVFLHKRGDNRLHQARPRPALARCRLVRRLHLS